MTKREVDRLSKALEVVDRDAFCVDDRGDRIPQTSAEHIVADMLRLVDAQPGNHVLEIGTGSGYSTALLAELVEIDGSVCSVDVDPELADRTSRLLAPYSHVHLLTADGSGGWLQYAPYDRVVAWCSVTHIPEAWSRQTRPDGILVIPLRGGARPRIVRYIRHADGHLEHDGEIEGAFIPLTASPFHPWE